jgi:hypothetical protein
MAVSQSVPNESVKPPSTVLWDTSRQLCSASTDARPAYTTLAEQAHLLVQHKSGVRGAGSGSGKAGALATSCASGVVQFQTARYEIWNTAVSRRTCQCSTRGGIGAVSDYRYQ